MTTALETRYAGHRFRSRLGETARKEVDPDSPLREETR